MCISPFSVINIPLIIKNSVKYETQFSRGAQGRHDTDQTALHCVFLSCDIPFHPDTPAACGLCSVTRMELSLRAVVIFLEKAAGGQNLKMKALEPEHTHFAPSLPRPPLLDN